MKMQTTYLGMKLNSPLVVSACSLSEKIDNIAKMEDNGAGAVVLHSLFEEQIQKEEKRYWNVEQANNAFVEGNGFFPDFNSYNRGPHEYMDHIRKAKDKVRIPIIASLNGISSTGWIDYSKMMEEAGADAIEVNIFFIPADLDMSSAEVEHRYLNIINAIRQTINIPIAVKLNPYFSAMGNMALRMENAGADGLVLFNRFYQPDFDINQMKIKHSLEYSEASEIRLPLLWLALLYEKLGLCLAATTGVQSGIEVVKYLLAGADVVMTASSLYKHGISYMQTLNQQLEQWMDTMGYDNVAAFRGQLSQKHIQDPTSYERANYIRILESVK
jgi:dihydroorotate dehydrogenase (fumarate)